MKLSKQTQYSINWLYSKNHSIEQISKELKLKESVVSSYIEKNANINNEVVIPVKSKPVKSSRDLMIRHTRDKKTNNVSIMTGEASSFNDSARKKFPENSTNKPYIFNPNK